MQFSVYEYLLPGLIPYLLSVALVIGYIVFILRKRPQSPRLIWGGCLASVGLMLAILAFIFPSMAHAGPLLSNTTRYEASGIVENIRSAGKTHIYYDRAAGEFTTASYISLSGTEYYILSDRGIYVGQNLYLKFCPEGFTVVEWDVVPLETVDLTQAQNGDSTSLPMMNVPYVRAEILIAFFGCVMIALRIFEGPIGKLRLSYIFRNEVTGKKEVLPRKPSVATCLTETIVTGFFILSWITHNFTLIGFLGVVAGILWLLQVRIQKTAIWYGDDEVFYRSMGDTSMFRIADVKSARMVPTRISGFMQLEIRLASGDEIILNQLHYSGLQEFYNWLLSRKV